MRHRSALVTLGCCGLLLAIGTGAKSISFDGGVPIKGDHPAFAATLSVGGETARDLAGPGCGMRNPVACQTTNELVRAPGFRRAVQSFGGKARTKALGAREALLSDVLIATLGGPPDGPIRLADGSFLFTACVAHSCTEKGAIVLTSSGSIAMAATLTNHLVNEGASGNDWGPRYSRLDIFLTGSVSAAPPWRRPIRAWAKVAYRENREHFGAIFARRGAGLMEYRWLVSPASGNLTRLSRSRIE